MTEQEVKDKLYEKDIILDYYKEFEQKWVQDKNYKKCSQLDLVKKLY
jgi:hypothetical protein